MRKHSDGAEKRSQAQETSKRIMTMGSYAERAYFDGEHCKHIADREEFLRLRKIRGEGEAWYANGRRKIRMRDYWNFGSL